MRIFRRPAHLNAFRGNVLDISSRFRFQSFSDSIRFRRAVPSCSPFPVPSPVPSFSSLLASAQPLPVCLAVPSSRLRYLRPAYRVVQSGSWAKRAVAIRCVGRPLVVIRCVPSACPTRPVHRVVERGGRRRGAASPMPSAHLRGFRAVGAICIYSFGKSPNI